MQPKPSSPLSPINVSTLLRFFFLLNTTLLLACGGKKLGEPCEWKGSGFTAQHNCATGTFCLNGVDCPNKTSAPLQQCVRSCQKDSHCDTNQTCYAYSQSQSYCIPNNHCSS